MRNNRLPFILAVALILMAGIARIVNHEMQWYNIAPVGALGLFAGAVIKDKRYAFLLAISAQLIGDLYFQFFTQWQGFYGIEQVCVYAALICITLLGITMRKPKALKVLGFSVMASVIFFIVSNLGVWLSIEMGKVDLYGYGKGFTGFASTYIAAIPFFKNTLAGDLTGSIILFGSYFILQQVLVSKMQKAEV